ncbi:MAG: regulator, partial [Wenzhouxiangellaceae bacterium]|nr:regulator [Wenzhouxiangellaceae bacterium]
SFNARTETDCTVLEFDGKSILAECESDAEFGYDVIKRFSGLMAERLEAAHRKMVEQWSVPGFA